jgi:hypothetical protein
VRAPIHFIPIVTTILAVAFAIVIFRRYRERRSGPHLLWWGAGILLYGVGTFTEASVTLLGWSEPLFRAWYISGALLGGAPLAQGTVYLLMRRRTANVLAVVLLGWIAVAAAFVLLTPIDSALVETHRLSGRVMEWTWVRLFSPLVNTYAAVFLIGGAVYSALRFRRLPQLRHRYIGNVLIAIGALLPGIGGTATRMGYVEVLYVTELLGLCLIWLGYRWNVREPVPVQAVDAMAA